MNKLIISPTKKLSPEQVKFNRLIERIEKAQAKYNEIHGILNEKLAMTQSEIQPLHNQWCEDNLLILESFARYLQNNKISNVNLEYVRLNCVERYRLVLESPHQFDEEQLDRMQNACQIILGLPSQEEVEKQKKEASEHPPQDKRSQKKRKAEIEEAKEYLRYQFEPFGLHLELDDIDTHLTDEEIDALFQQRVQEAFERKEAEQEAKRQKRKKNSKKASKTAEVKAATQKDFNQLYKSLAKILHPDTEMDEAKKAVKMEWMKRLTHAYREGNLQDLLLIEMEWGDADKKDPSVMSEEQLASYNQLLANQARTLEKSVGDLYFEPRYRPLMYFAMSKESVRYLNSLRSKMRYENLKKETMHVYSQINGDEQVAKAYIKSIIAFQKDKEARKNDFETLIMTDIRKFR